MNQYYVIPNPFKQIHWTTAVDISGINEVQQQTKRWRRGCEARDYLQAKNIPVPARLLELITISKDWLISKGFVPFYSSDFTQEELDAINKHFWELG